MEDKGKLNLNTEEIIFEDVDILSPLSINTPTESYKPDIPPPPNIINFSNNVRELNFYLSKYSDGSYNIRNVLVSIQNNFNNYRENLLFTIYKKNYIYNIFKNRPIFSEWIKQVDLIKNKI